MGLRESYRLVGSSSKVVQSTTHKGNGSNYELTNEALTQHGTLETEINLPAARLDPKTWCVKE